MEWLRLRVAGGVAVAAGSFPARHPEAGALVCGGFLSFNRINSTSKHESSVGPNRTTGCRGPVAQVGWDTAATGSHGHQCKASVQPLMTPVPGLAGSPRL